MFKTGNAAGMKISSLHKLTDIRSNRWMKKAKQKQKLQQSMDLILSKIFRAGLASICFSTSPVKWNPASPSCSLSLRTSRSLERWVKSSSSISGGLKVLSPQASKTTIETLNSDIAKLGGQITKVSSQVNAPNTEKEVGLVCIVVHLGYLVLNDFPLR